ARAAGVPVVEQPRNDPAVGIDAALDVDHSRRAEIRPRELFRARPDELHRTIDGARKARGFDCYFTRVLPAVGGTGVWDDHPHAVFGNPERLGKLTAHSPWTLRAGPHRQLAVAPFGNRRA